MLFYSFDFASIINRKANFVQLKIELKNCMWKYAELCIWWRREREREEKLRKTPLHAVAAMVCSELFGSMTRRLLQEEKGSVNSKWKILIIFCKIYLAAAVVRMPNNEREICVCSELEVQGEASRSISKLKYLSWLGWPHCIVHSDHCSNVDRRWCESQLHIMMSKAGYNHNLLNFEVADWTFSCIVHIVCIFFDWVTEPPAELRKRRKI